MTNNVKNYVQGVQELRQLVLEQVATCEYFSPDEKTKIMTQLKDLDTVKDLLEMKDEITTKIATLSKSLA